MSVALTALAPLPTSAQSRPARAEVRQLLSGFEDVPSDAVWRERGEAVLPILMELYQDTEEPPYVRMRAMEATAAFPRPAVRTFLRAVAEAPRQSDLFVRAALLAMARGFGASAVQDLAPYLGHRTVAVRSGAALALDRVHTPDALGALRARLPEERAPTVRTRIESALRR